MTASPDRELRRPILLILARVFTGVAAAGIIPLSMAWIGDKVSYAER